MISLSKFPFSLSLLAGLIACDKDDNMGTLIVNVRDNAKVEEIFFYYSSPTERNTRFCLPS